MTQRTHITVLLSSSRTSGIEIAQSLTKDHPQLVVVLCDAAAPLARHDHPQAHLIQALQAAGATVFAEQAACERRGIEPERLGSSIRLVHINEVADVLVDSTTKVVWL